MRQRLVTSITLLLLTLAWSRHSWGAPESAMPDPQFFVFKLIGVIVLLLFLPLTAVSYYCFRQRRRKFEVERILDVLQLDPKDDLAYRKVYGDDKSGYHFLWSVTYTSVVSGIGLALLFFGHDIFQVGATNGEFPIITFGADAKFPAKGSRLISSMAFLGAYIWGLQYLFRRYTLNDLLPGVYYNLSVRMILAALVALVLYNGYEAIADKGGVTSKMWPVLAFLIGIFPQRGLRWLTERLPMLSSEANGAVRAAPLDMIEGVESQDKMRLEELGIDTCYDLAVADFVPLILNTSYSARQLVDWILQAKLCIYVGNAIGNLRQQGIRTIIDLEPLTSENLAALAAETSVTISALQHAHASVSKDAEIGRLQRLGEALGRFTKEQF